MEKYFGNAYRGDPGVPHSGPEPFENIWIGSVAFSALSWINPYMWQLSNQYKKRVIQSSSPGTRSCGSATNESLLNWHDKSMLFEQYHWKKACEKNQPYEFKWNQMPREIRDSYYYNWPVYFR